MPPVAEAISQARRIVPRYGIAEPVSNGDIQQLLNAFHVRVRYLEGLSVSAFLLPPDETGMYGLRMRADLGGNVRRFFLLHDLCHVIVGEADELMWEDYDDPYPHFERRADLFAMMGILHGRDRVQDPDWIEALIWKEVPADIVSWKYRVPEIARALASMNGE